MSGALILLNLAGAVALLLWATHMVRSGVERAFGAGLDARLRRAFPDALRAIGAGGLMAMALQSATAVALIVAGFAASGHVAAARGIAAVVGADLGSAVVTGILRLDLSLLVPVLLLFGVIAFRSSTEARWRQVGRILIGIGLLLLSLRLIGEASEPLRDGEMLPLVLGYLSRDWLTAFLLAALMTWLFHSSIAAILLVAALADRVAGLPSGVEPDHEDTKRFDVLLLNTQLAALRGEPFERERQKIIQIAGLLEGQQSIPAIKQQLALILDVQDDDWWTDVTYPMLEHLRRGLRHLVPLIERAKRGAVYTDFEDSFQGDREVVLPGTGGGGSYEFAQFRKKAQHFLNENLAEEAIAKVRSGQPLTRDDLAELQRILIAAGVGDEASFALASERAGNLGYFVRTLIGLDRAAAKDAFADFLDDKRHTRAQIEFINLIIDELTERGMVEPGRVYEDPYVGLAPRGPEDLFAKDELDRLFELLARLARAETGT